jgi:5'-nucleotidase
MTTPGAEEGRRPLILVTNDDGITSPGLLAAIAAVTDLGDLMVVAPSVQQSGMGRSAPVPRTGEFVSESHLQANGQQVPAFAVPGSPAQAVVYAVVVLAPRKPDLVISGINYGENLGNQVTGSGTVGAALEAAALGIPALAVSLETDKAYHYRHGADVPWGTAVDVTRRFAQVLLGGVLAPDVDVLNINVPADATPETTWRLTSISRQQYYDVFPIRRSPRPELTDLDYRVVIDRDTLEPGSDIHAFSIERAISVTPLSIDLTSRIRLADLAEMVRSRLKA